MTLESIALLSCRSPFLDDNKIYCPMANLYLKSFVNKHLPSVNVRIMDDNYDLNNLSNLESYQAIGLSVMTPQREEANKLARAIKQKYPDKKIIIGGPHVKHYLNDVYNNPDYDKLVGNDGEVSLLQILSESSGKRVFLDTMTRDDIAKAPRPDRTSQNAIEVIKGYHYKLGDREATTMMTSRGCPMACTFCEDAQTAVKWSSLDNLKAEMDDITRLGYKGVYIFDDLFAIAMPMVRPICNELKKRDLIYRCNGQANYFTKWGEDFAKMLAETGCYEIAFGHESGSQKILDAVDKRTTVNQNYESIEFAKKHGIKVKSFLMLGLPGEDEESIKATERFIKTAGMDDFQLAVYYPYKGTKIRDAIDKGIADFDLQFEREGLGAYGQKGGSTEACVRTSRFTSDELLQIRDELVRKYKPQSHTNKWKEDKFFDTWQKS